MSQFVDWEYYSSLHSKVKENDFLHTEQLAEKEVQRVIGWIRWANITTETFEYEQLKDCICNVMDKMSTDAQSGNSESYVVQTEEQLRSELQSSIRSWLSGTGLVGAY